MCASVGRAVNIARWDRELGNGRVRSVSSLGHSYVVDCIANQAVGEKKVCAGVSLKSLLPTTFFWGKVRASPFSQTSEIQSFQASPIIVVHPNRPKREENKKTKRLLLQMGFEPMASTFNSPTSCRKERHGCSGIGKVTCYHCTTEAFMSEER